MQIVWTNLQTVFLHTPYFWRINQTLKNEKYKKVFHCSFSFNVCLHIWSRHSTARVSPASI